LAVCLEAGYYPVKADDLNFHQKLRRLEMLTELNQRTKYNSVHISLNFDPSEKLPDELLKQIAEEYLDKLGFGGQPYLLYRHEDAGHPHLHIVTTNIQPDGRAIHLHNLGKRKSEPARKEIEIKYGLIKAEESNCSGLISSNRSMLHGCFTVNRKPNGPSVMCCKRYYHYTNMLRWRN